MAVRFDVDQNALTVRATESRRLGRSSEARQLAGTWSVDFTLSVPESKVAACRKAAAAMQSDPTILTETIQMELVKARVSPAEAAAIAVSSVGSLVSIATTTTSGPDEVPMLSFAMPSRPGFIAASVVGAGTMWMAGAQ